MHSFQDHQLRLEQITLENQTLPAEEQKQLPTIKCVNCNDRRLFDTCHKASDRRCAIYREEQDLQACAYLKNLSRRDALKFKGRLRDGVSFTSSMDQKQAGRMATVESAVRTLQNAPLGKKKDTHPTGAVTSVLIDDEFRSRSDSASSTSKRKLSANEVVRTKKANAVSAGSGGPPETIS